MSYATTDGASSANVAQAVTPAFWPSEVRTRFQPKQHFPIVFKQRIFSPDGGRTTIELREYPTLSLNTADFSVSLEDWGIRIPYAAIADLPRQVCRKFLLLWGKAERRTLNSKESDMWLKILDAVDFQAFSTERAGPRIYEGKLLRKEPYCLVEWSDGERSRIAEPVARSLDLLDPRELFTAEVTLGREDEVTKIEKVVPLGSQESVMAGVFEEWPTPA